MIEIKVEPYCIDCPEFEVDSKKMKLQTVGTPYVTANTTIYCLHRTRCKFMVDYLKGKVGEQSAN